MYNFLQITLKIVIILIANISFNMLVPFPSQTNYINLLKHIFIFLIYLLGFRQIHLYLIQLLDSYFSKINNPSGLNNKRF